MKQKKIKKRIANAIPEKHCLGITLKPDGTFNNLIPIDLNDRIAIFAHDRDFRIDGYVLLPLCLIERAEKKPDRYQKLLAFEGVTGQIGKPHINISSFRAAFSDLQNRGENITVYFNDNGCCAVGRIIDAKKKSIIFRELDIYGKWQENEKIYFRNIQCIVFGDTYTTVYSKYID